MQVVERKLLRGYGFVAEQRSSEYRRRETKPDMLTAMKGKVVKAALNRLAF